MIDRLLNIAVAYLEKGVEFLFSHLMTIEGIIALLFGMFFLGLISKLRS